MRTAPGRGIARPVARTLREGGFSLVGAKLLRRGSEALLVRAATRSVQAFRGRDEQALDFAFDFRLGDLVIRPLQVRSEIEGLLALVRAERPRTVLEIGTASGGTAFLFARSAAEDALIVTVDFPFANVGFGGKHEFARRGRLYRAFALPGQRVEPLIGDSHEQATLERIRVLLGGRPVDFLFIDGDHSAAGVRRDLAMYGVLVRPGGLIAFHDIVPGPEEAVGGVPELWREVKSGDAIELVEDWEQGGFGIGVLRVQ